MANDTGLSPTYFAAVFRRLGLTGISDEILAAAKEGDDDLARITERVRNTEAYNKAFPGITERIKQGLPAINEGEYLELRRSYKRSLETYGLRIEDVAVDSKGRSLSEEEALGKLIGNDVSPVEFAERLQVADQWTKSADPQTKQALQEFYGLTDKDLMAYALNPEGGQTLLKRRAAGVQVAAEALRSGFDIYSTRAARPQDELSREYLQQIGMQGLTAESSLAEIAAQTRIAGEAVARAGEERANIERLADISGVDLTAQEQVEAQLGEIRGVSAATTDRRAKGKVERLRSQERARFGGSSAGANVFMKDESGSF